LSDDETIKMDSSFFESEPVNTTVGISCQNLRKVFSGKVAVNRVSLNMYKGQITVLLGHNGAGKTTTMNMITGIFPPSHGSAYVDGYNVRTQTRQARRSLSLCPQENIIYDELTVEQHLKLYAVLKDHPWEDVNKEIDKILKLVSLSDKKTTLSSNLSGGMKRKLALGIAMVGGSKILILDEPTSGMDPEARRVIWDVLQNIRSERTILLTTHFMEEADVSNVVSSNLV
jgi:ATP-binding cassette, subfamily A (ABC1), member 3